MDTIASVIDSDDGLLIETSYQIVDRFQQLLLLAPCETG